MHSSLALTLEGLPLGFTAKKFWNRDKFKGAHEIYRRINATRIPIDQKESYRWLEGVRNSNKLLNEPHPLIHIGDWEADIYDLKSLFTQKKVLQFFVSLNLYPPYWNSKNPPKKN
jgi:hypothetical protein